ncbi:MAG: 16S rRNA pseudouridine(516) synthase, partial [Clostridiales bacterium]|nr:16S rRNA pseudouridine(516) synthase [Clostridiales bacterium]
MKKERADKIISSQSTITRSETVKLIRSGKVKINGEVIKDNSLKIDPQTDVIEINGEVLNCKKFIYIMMNKPGG